MRDFLKLGPMMATPCADTFPWTCPITSPSNPNLSLSRSEMHARRKIRIGTTTVLLPTRPKASGWVERSS